MPRMQPGECPYSPSMMQAISAAGAGGHLLVGQLWLRVETCDEPWGLRITPLPADAPAPQATATETVRLTHDTVALVLPAGQEPTRDACRPPDAPTAHPRQVHDEDRGWSGVW